MEEMVPGYERPPKENEDWWMERKGSRKEYVAVNCEENQSPRTVRIRKKKIKNLELLNSVRSLILG